MSPKKSSNKDTIAAMIASSRPRNPNLEKIKVTHGFIEEDGSITPRQPGEGEAHNDHHQDEKMMLTIVEREYPSGALYGVFFIGRHEIGRADKMEDGWRVFGKRKTLTAEMAAKAMIDGSISKARREEAHARKMLDALRIYCGGR